MKQRNWLNSCIKQRGEIYLHIFLPVKEIFSYLFRSDFSASVNPGRNFSLFVPGTTHKPFTVLLCSAKNTPPYRATCAKIFRCKWLSRASSPGTWLMCFGSTLQRDVALIQRRTGLSSSPSSSPRWCFAFPASLYKTAKVLKFSQLRAMPHAEVLGQYSEEV